MASDRPLRITFPAMSAAVCCTIVGVDPRVMVVKTASSRPSISLHVSGAAVHAFVLPILHKSYILICD